jgi:antitoxin component YwqK of YwqJK toxin-antitoxin module
MSKLTKTIEINIGYDVIIPVVIDENNGLLYTIFNEAVKHNEPIKINDLLPKLTDTQALNLYIYFLRQSGIDNLPIVDRQTMIYCLQIYDLLDDVNFFRLLLKSLFKLWTILSPMLYSNKISNEVKWEIFLYCPYQLLPEIWQEDKAFMRLWHKNKDNKLVTINSDEVFTYQHVSERTMMEENNLAGDGDGDEDEDGEVIIVPITVMEKVTSYVRHHDDIVVYNREVSGIKNSQVMVTEYNTSYNGMEQGKKVTSIVNNTTTINMINGISNGPETNYDETKLKSKNYNINGKIEGIKTCYYDNGQVRRITKYMDGTFDGLDIAYNNPVKPRPTLAIEWKAGYKLKQTFYSENRDVEADYVLNDKVFTLPISYSFYTPDGVLTRKITNPIDANVEKYDTYYNRQGNSIDEKIYSKEQRFNVKRNTWY